MIKTTHPHIAALLFNRPLMIYRPKLHAIIRALHGKIGLDVYDEFDDDDDVPSSGRGGSSGMVDGIAAITVYGSLAKRAVGMQAQSGLTTYESLSAQVLDAATNPDCKAILLDVDSYGGECSGAFDLSDLIYQARQSLPVYGIANCAAYSAGYAALSACEKVFLTQDGGVGSIGVIAEHCDESEYDAALGLKYTAITFGAHKNDFSPHEALSKDALEELQADVDRLGNMFVALVARNRKMSPADVLATQAGLFGGQDAIKAGLADQIGTRADALAQLQARVGNRRLVPMPGQATGAMAPPVVPATLAAEAPASADATSTRSNTPMSETNTAGAPNGSPPDVEAIRQAATKEARDAFSANVTQIQALCSIAGRQELAVDYIQQQLTVAQVQEKLLALRAAASHATTPTGDSIELETNFLPQSTVSKGAVNNPDRLIDAVNRRLKAQKGRN